MAQDLEAAGSLVSGKTFREGMSRRWKVSQFQDHKKSHGVLLMRGMEIWCSLDILNPLTSKADSSLS